MVLEELQDLSLKEKWRYAYHPGAKSTPTDILKIATNQRFKTINTIACSLCGCMKQGTKQHGCSQGFQNDRCLRWNSLSRISAADRQRQYDEDHSDPKKTTTGETTSQ
jgi:hypothetical protein